MLAIFYSPRFRQIAIQVLVIIATVAAIGYLAHNAATNLKMQGIASGFGFLEDRAGFSIIQSLIEHNEDASYGRAFWVGLLNTGIVSFLGIVIATIIGFIVGVARLSSNLLINRLASAFVEWIRNIPLLLQVFFWYFVVLRSLPGPRQSISLLDSAFINNRGLYLPVPSQTVDLWLFIGTAAIAIGYVVYGLLRERSNRWLTMGVGIAVLASWWKLSSGQWDVPRLTGFNFSGGIGVIPEFSALLAALSIYTSAFIAEIVRAGIKSVPAGQVEAAKSLGLSEFQTLRQVVVPQALRVIIPPLTSQYLNLTKNSSLAAAIGYPDLVSVFAGTVLNQTGQAVEVIAITMSVYLTISLTISLLMNLFNARFAIVGHDTKTTRT